jgi:hypothetical protein
MDSYNFLQESLQAEIKKLFVLAEKMQSDKEL